MDLQVLIIDSVENWNSIKTELTKHPEANKIEISKSQKPSSIPKVIPPIPPFSANHLLIEPKIELLTSVRSPELPIQKEITSVSETITDLEHVEKKCVEAMPDIKNRKEKLEKKKKKPRYDADLSSIFADPKLRGSEKLLGSDSEKELRQPKKGKSKILVGSFFFLRKT